MNGGQMPQEHSDREQGRDGSAGVEKGTVGMSRGSKPLKVLLLIAALMLCIAVIPTLPQGYYTLLRFMVCGAAAYAAFQLKHSPSLSGHFIPLLIVAVLYNPLMPVYLTPLIWLVIHLAGAVYFLKLSKKI
jgi:hypothetical protein